MKLTEFFYKSDPDDNELMKAHKMFDSLWDKGIPIQAMWIYVSQPPICTNQLYSRDKLIIDNIS